MMWVISTQSETFSAHSNASSTRLASPWVNPCQPHSVCSRQTQLWFTLVHFDTPTTNQEVGIMRQKPRLGIKSNPSCWVLWRGSEKKKSWEKGSPPCSNDFQCWDKPPHSLHTVSVRLWTLMGLHWYGACSVLKLFSCLFICYETASVLKIHIRLTGGISTSDSCNAVLWMSLLMSKIVAKCLHFLTIIDISW